MFSIHKAVYLTFSFALSVNSFFIPALSPDLCKSTPLSTANAGLFLQIPRLEPGLRLRDPVEDLVEVVYSACNALDWLAVKHVAYNYNDEKTMQQSELDKQALLICEKIKTVQKNISTYFRRVLASTIIMASSICSPMMPSLRKVAIASTAVATAVGAPSAAFASVYKKYDKLAPMEKLGTTPLFFVCNSGGNPYLQEDHQAGKPEQRIIVYFMSSEDANDYLQEMAQGSPGSVNEFRLMTTSMEKVMNRIQAKKQSRKLGKFPLSTVYRIQPSSRQCDNADKVLSATTSTSTSLKAQQRQKTKSNTMAIPMFQAKGLVIKRAGGEMVSPYYFCLEDLKDDWNKLLKEQPAGTSTTATSGLSANPVISVVDFTEVMCLSEGLSVSTLPAVATTNGKVRQMEVRPSTSKAPSSSITTTQEDKEVTKILHTPGIVPPRRELEMLRKYYRNQAGMKGEFQQTRIVGLT